MIYILAERKYFLMVNQEARPYDSREFETYNEAEKAWDSLDPSIKQKISVCNFDTPLYHGDFHIARKITETVN